MPQTLHVRQSRRKRLVFSATLALAAALVALLTTYKLSVANTYRVFPVPTTSPRHAAPLVVPSTTARGGPADPVAEARVRGQHLLGDVLACTTCHGADLGGRLLQDDALVRVRAPNLTAPRSDRAWQDALRDGVDAERRGLWGMPTRAHAALTDQDLAAVVAAVRAAPPVARALPTPRLHWRGHVAAAWRRLRLVRTDTGRTRAPFDHAIGAAWKESTQTGAYLYAIANCAACHGEPARAVAGAGPTSIRVQAGEKTGFGIRLANAHRALAAQPLDFATPPPADGFAVGRREVALPPGGFARLTNVEAQSLWRYLQGL